MADVLLYHKERHSLLMNCFKHSMYRQIGGALSESSTHWWVSMCHFPWLFTFKQHTKCQIISTLSVQKMGWCTERRDIHCLWSGSNPFLDVCDRWKKLLIASMIHLCVSVYHFSLWSHLKLHTNYQILISPQYGRWVAVPQGETFIA